MSKTYQIEVEEILQKVVEIEADSLEEAIDIAQERYHDCEIILEAEDLKETNFDLYQDVIINDKKPKDYER